MKQNTRRHGTLGLLVAAIIVFGGTYALAAVRRLETPRLGTMTTGTSVCQSTPLQVTFAFELDGSLGVTISDLNTTAGSCGGRSLLVTLHTSTHVAHAKTTTVPKRGSSVTIDYPDVDPSTVTSVTAGLAG